MNRVESSTAVRTVLLCDLVGSAQLVRRLGDDRAASLLERHDRLARDLAARWQGREIDKTDGFLFLFRRSVSAVGFALGYQEGLERLSAESDVPIAARVGIHLGEVRLRRNLPEDVRRGAKPLEVEGLAKVTAARLMALARSGQILLTRAAFDLARRGAVDTSGLPPELHWLEHGVYLAKGLEEALEVCEVGVEGKAPLLPPGDSEKAWRVRGEAPGSGSGVSGGSGGSAEPSGIHLGARLGGFEVRGLLGRGGMGEVFLARDHQLGRSVAIKVLSDEAISDPDRVRRFQREAQSLAALNHPNIVAIYSLEEAEGRRFLAMELVEGPSLESLLAGGPMPAERFFEIALPLTDAVAAAHRKGITHRDLKPGNVMLTREGRVKILDFGLAKLREAAAAAPGAQTGASTLTVVGQVVGTVPYMSPEQLDGRAVDERSDLFSLGVVLYEIAAGRRPFESDSTASLTAAILRDPAPPLDEVNREVPPGLGRILARCLEKDPGDRYPSAAELHEDLRRLARRGGAAAVAGDWRPRSAHRRRWGIVGLAAAAALAAIAVGLRFGGGVERRPEAAPGAPRAEALEAVAPASERPSGPLDDAVPAAAPAPPPPATGPAPAAPAAAAPATAEPPAAEPPRVAASGAPAGGEPATPARRAAEGEAASRAPDRDAPPPAASRPPAEEPAASPRTSRQGTPAATAGAAATGAGSGAAGAPETSARGPEPSSPPPSGPGSAAAGGVEAAPPLVPRNLPPEPAGDPAVAGPPTAAAPEPAAPADETIRATLAAYVAAYEALDVDRIRRLWPSMGSDVYRRTKDAFRQQSAAELELDCGSITVAGDRATASCLQRLTAIFRNGDRESVETVRRIELERAAGGWVIRGFD